MTGQIFTPYPVTGNDIRAYADDVEVRAAPIEEIDHQVAGQHTVAVDAVEGAIVDQMSTANVPVTERTRDVRQKVAFGAGALRWWALTVDKYNETSDHPWGPRSVAKLNEAYDAASIDARHGNHDLDEVRASLTREYHELEANLDTDAEAVKGMLERGPADQAVLRGMFMAGFLPDGAGTLFDVAFTEAEWRGHLIQRLNAGALPDIMAIPAGYLATLLNDSDIMAAVRSGLDLDAEQGRTDGRLLTRLESDLTSDELAHTHQRLLWIQAYADYAQSHLGDDENVQLSQDMLDYLEAFYGEATDGGLGALDDLDAYDSPTNIGLAQEGTSFDAAFANGLLALSDERIGGDYELLPVAVKEASVAIGSAAFNEARYDLLREEGEDNSFLPLAELLDDSTIEPGTNLSKHLAIRTTQLDLEYRLETVEEWFDRWGLDPDDPRRQEVESRARELASEGLLYNMEARTALQMFDVASRNLQAMHDLITNENMDGFPDASGGWNWDVHSMSAIDEELPEPIADMPGTYDATDFLRFIHTTEWADHGASAGKPMLGLAMEHATNGPNAELADEALMVWDDFIASVGEDGVYDELREVGEVNPQLAESIATTVALHLDWFGDDSEDPEDLGGPEDWASDRILDYGEAQRLMTLAVTTDESAAALRLGLMDHMQDNLDNMSGDVSSASTVAVENARLMRMYDAALHNEAIGRTTDAQAAADEAHLRRTNAARMGLAALNGFAITPPGQISGGLDLLIRLTGSGRTGINTFFTFQMDDEAAEVPTFPLNGDVTDTSGAEFTYRSTYELLQTQMAAGVIDPATVEPYLVDSEDPTQLRPFNEIDIQTAGEHGENAGRRMATVEGDMVEALAAAGVQAETFRTQLVNMYDHFDRYALSRDEIEAFNERGELPPD